MDIFSVTPQMERHMNTVECFGIHKAPMHSMEEEEAANKFLKSGKGDFDDSFIYDELEEDVDQDEKDLADEELSKDELMKVALDDIAKRLTSKPVQKISPKVAKPVKAVKIKKEVKKKEIKYIMKGERYGGVFHGIF